MVLMAVITIYSVTILIGVDTGVDKLSNTMIVNFLFFSVDKSYTLVVYSSTEVREIAIQTLLFDKSRAFKFVL
jgi:hypothetical protein